MMSLGKSVARLYRQMSGTTPSDAEEENNIEDISNNMPIQVESDTVDEKEFKPESDKLYDKEKESESEKVNEKSLPILIPKVLPPIQPKKAPSPAPSYSSFDPPSYQDLHPFAPTPTEPSSPTPSEDQTTPKVPDVEDNQSAPLVDPNWFPGLPRAPPGVFVQPPRNRSKVERIRYLADFQRLISVPGCKLY
jgi:hypothetical protein